jgi:adenylate cyclase
MESWRNPINSRIRAKQLRFSSRFMLRLLRQSDDKANRTMAAKASGVRRLSNHTIDWARGTVTNGSGSAVTLRAQALAVFKMLAAKPGELVSKDELMSAVWPNIAVTDDSLVQCITEIRKALGDEEHTIIKTVPKRGYVFEPVAAAVHASRRNWIGLAAALLGVIVLAAVYFWPSHRSPVAQPAIAVLPFTNMSGDPSQDYLGPGIAEDIITMLASYPTLRVVSRTSSFVYDKPVKVQQVGQDLKVNYVIEGSVRKAGGKVRVAAQLIDAATGDHVWANRYDEEGGDVAALQSAVANKIYNTVAGLRGEIRKKEEADAWTKSAPSLEEYDYYLRGHQLFFRVTKEDTFKAREVWQEGLTKFPNSGLLRTKIVFTYTRAVFNEWTDNPGRDLDIAWKLGKEAEAMQDKSRLETLLNHWAMAYLYYLHEGDFERSAAEAEAAVKLVPNDPFTRADVAQFLAFAGRPERAIEWGEDSIRRDANPLDWYFGNLALAYYFADRPTDAIAQSRKMKQPWKLNLAAAYARLGELDEARALVAQVLKDYPGWTQQKEAVWPTGKQPQFAAPLLKAYLADLAKAGLPEH